MKNPYDDGYKTGLNWKKDYYPGGPWVMYSGYGDTPEESKRCKQTQSNSREWHHGFKDGLKESECG